MPPAPVQPAHRPKASAPSEPPTGPSAKPPDTRPTQATPAVVETTVIVPVMPPTRRLDDIAHGASVERFGLGQS
ncbi:hypothetical protein RQP53_07650 [Paucibacter sp. APW11]|uniref:Uncharacterized protein n=1 Tax=Roseateles aquae TaxID=3077235 RepID=A0ABU3P996_9BURK|nr:hypothetical protein [Paucibacter sp. APW11]MDT8999139.1 hypothetical protein [Paucibacter sp. APW11]